MDCAKILLLRLIANMNSLKAQPSKQIRKIVFAVIAMKKEIVSPLMDCMTAKVDFVVR